MIWLDLPMPNSCGECEFIATFDDGRFGCVQLVEENKYGMREIRNPYAKLNSCPLHTLDDEVLDLIIKRRQTLNALRDDAIREMEVLEKYIF